MADVFVNPYAGQGKAWSLQNCFLHLKSPSIDIDTNNGLGVLAATESVQIQYSRQINTRYPLMASKAPIKILGVPTGTCTLGAILGPYSGITLFLKAFGSSCNPFTLEIKQLKSSVSFSRQGEDCQEGTTEHTIKLEGCLGTQVTYTIQMQDALAIAQGQFVLTFDKMDWSSK